MTPRFLVVLGAAVLTATVAVPADAAQRSKCQRLSGKDRAPDSHVKLVKRPSRERRLADGSRAADLVGCVLPRGRVYTIATRKGVQNDLAEPFGFAIRQVAGPTVLLDRWGTEGGYGSDMSTMVWDLRGGRSYTIARSCNAKDISCTGENSYARKAFITREGRAVAGIERYRDAEPDPSSRLTVLIARFAPDGARADLDVALPADLEARSLALAGNIASWTHAGQPRSADISSVSPPG